MDAQLPALLRRYRRERRLSLKDVARQLGVHFTTVSSWERGRSEPSYATLAALARLYGVSPAAFLDPAKAVPPRHPFRPLGRGPSEGLIKRLEELRLAVCLARELRAGDPRDLAERSGVSVSRLTALASGDVPFRPTEVGALLRELGAGAPVERLDAGPGGEAALLPAGLERQIGELLDGLRRYVAGDAPDRSHQ